METPTHIVQEIQLQFKPDFGPATLPTITSAAEAYEILKQQYNPDYLSIREEFIVLYLNNANRVLGCYKGFSGGITSTVADIRLILGIALKGLSTGIVLSHNHPSGNLKPSDADKKLTEALKNAAELLQIKVLDHLIVAPDGKYFSFADEGLL